MSLIRPIQACYPGSWPIITLMTKHTSICVGYAEFAQARFILAKVAGLNLAERQVIFSNRPALNFDTLSINTGSTPCKSTVPGASEHTVAVKPVSQFLKLWQDINQQLEMGNRPSLIIVGGGAAGVEIALACRHRSPEKLEIHLVHQQPSLLDTHPPAVGRRLADVCTQRNINLHLGEEVIQAFEHSVLCRSGLTIEGDHILWATGACAPNWIADSGIETTHNGFIQVTNTLQSTSHPFVFAAGDIASMKSYQRPKARGVCRSSSQATRGKHSTIWRKKITG